MADVSDARRGIQQKRKGYDHDAIAEVESLIVERLYLKYALDHGIISEKEYRNIVNSSANEILMNSRRIAREEEIGLKLGPNPTPQEVKAYIDELNKGRKIRTLDSVKTFEYASSPSWYNRYLSGQIVADVWMDRYEHATKKEQKEMLNNFNFYLKDNKNATLDGACTYLLGMDFAQTVDVYVEMRENESVLTKARDSLYTKTFRTKNVIKTL